MCQRIFRWLYTKHYYKTVIHESLTNIINVDSIPPRRRLTK